MDKYLRIIFSIIIKIFKLHPPRRASRFPFPAGIDNLAGIKKGKKKKNGDIACEISFQLLEISIQRIRLIVVQKLPQSFVRSFHVFSRIFFILSRPSFQLACHGDKKKKSCPVIAKKVEDNRGKLFAQFSPPRSGKIVASERAKENYYYFSRGAIVGGCVGCSTPQGMGGGEERKGARDRSEFRSRCTEGNKLRPLGDFSDPSRTRRCLSWWGIKMDCIFYENLLLRRGANVSHKYSNIYIYIFRDVLSMRYFSSSSL